MKRTPVTTGTRVPFIIRVPIRPGHDAERALRVADAASKTFFEDENNNPFGDAIIANGLWTSGAEERVRFGSGDRGPFPLLVFSGVVINQIAIFEKPDAPLRLFAEMVDAVIPQIDFDDKSRVVVTYGDIVELLSEKEPAKVANG